MMAIASTSLLSSSIQRTLLLLLLSPTLLTYFVSAQGCSNTCPPINFGTPVPSLCEGDIATASELVNVEKQYGVCHPTPAVRNAFSFTDFLGPGRITVMSNAYIGCNAGRRESGVFAHVAQKYYNRYGNRTTFITSIKGGTTCGQWAGMYQRDAVRLFPESDVTPQEMPLTVLDQDYELRDDWFTTPFGHPSYVILDGELRVRHKFIGPCCGYERYNDCTADIARALDETLSGYLDDLLAETDGDVMGNDYDYNNLQQQQQNDADSNAIASGIDEDASTMFCLVGFFSEWSACSVSCGEGFQFRWRTVRSATSEAQAACPAPVETRPCTADVAVCPETPSQQQCVPEFGASWEIETIASGFDGPRDVAFHPTPGLHLGSYSEGRTFHPDIGEEAWVVNGYNHSVSIVASLGTESQTTISRRDRGYYHYMINATALAFNSVGDSGRSAERDSFNYWAVCNDDLNTYLGSKEANNFMGPTLYNSDPRNLNTVNRLGEECGESEPCYFLHADMLHESPACVGITHDPEIATAYGTVYWAFDTTGNQQTGQLVRFDFQQPHGPGSMDHSVAAVRRYPDIQLARGPPGVHAGMVVHPTRRELYVAVPGANKILVVNADSGSYARTAREEYPIYSNRLPSFEYSIWECTDQRDFATGIQTPTGLALSPMGDDRLFVAERDTGKILVYDIATGDRMYEIETEFRTIGGMAFSPETETLHFVDEETNTLNAVRAQAPCNNPVPSRMLDTFRDEVFVAAETVDRQGGSGTFSLYRDYGCQVDPIIPDAVFFDQVHVDTGYASDNPDVQSTMAGMDETAALLANRTDCGPTSELNFDQLLLGGYYCHPCLPRSNGSMCDAGGVCTNIQWSGYYCDNEFWVVTDEETGRTVLQTSNKTTIATENEEELILRDGVTYRINVETADDDTPICILPLAMMASDDNTDACATRGPLMLTVGPDLPPKLFLNAGNDIVGSFAVESRLNNNGNNDPTESSNIFESEDSADDTSPNILDSFASNYAGGGGEIGETPQFEGEQESFEVETTSDDGNEDGGRRNRNVVVGAVVGGVGFLSILGAGAFYAYNRTRTRKNKEAKEAALEEGATFAESP